MKLFKILLPFVLIFVSILTIQRIFPHDPGVIYGMLIFTAPGGIATPFQFNMTYLPQFLTYNHGAAPLTSLRIETQEDGVLHDWNAPAIAAINGYMLPGVLPATNVLLRLANGHIPNKNVTISGVTAAVGAIPFFVASDCPGSQMFKTTNAQILALNPTTFENFTAIWVPTMAAVTDTCQVEYLSGHRQTFNINDLTNLTSLFQQLPVIMLNNINAYIHRAIFTCVAATPAYVMSVALKG